MMIALLRLVEAAEGRVVIDGEDTRKLMLKHLRQSVSIIPQVASAAFGC